MRRRRVIARYNIHNSVCQTCHVSGMMLEGPALSFLASLTLKSRVLWPEGTGPGAWKGQQHRPTAKDVPLKEAPHSALRVPASRTYSCCGLFACCATKGVAANLLDTFFTRATTWKLTQLKEKFSVPSVFGGKCGHIV